MLAGPARTRCRPRPELGRVPKSHDCVPSVPFREPYRTPRSSSGHGEARCDGEGPGPMKRLIALSLVLLLASQWLRSRADDGRPPRPPVPPELVTPSPPKAPVAPKVVVTIESRGQDQECATVGLSRGRLVQVGRQRAVLAS